MNRFLRSLLKTGLDFLEQSERAGRASRRDEDDAVRDAISFAAGISDTISLPEARAKFGALWGKRHVRREVQAETGYQARSAKAA